MKIAILQKHLREWIWRLIPITFVIGLVSYSLSKQIVSPHRRAVKLTVVLCLLTLMFRFDMIYSLYLFIVLFYFPSGVSIGNTNNILITLITLIWFIRAHSDKQRFFHKTEIDKFVVVLIIAHFVSLFNIETFTRIRIELVIIWKQIAACLFCYLIVRFVTDEKKLFNITRIIAIATGVLFLTGIVELFFPGTTIIPGWIKVRGQMGEGELGYRLEGMRLGGAIGSHALLSDFGTVTLFLMVFHFLRSENPISKVLWVLNIVITFIIFQATANRGAFFGLLLGILYFFYLFRHKMSFVKYVSLIAICVIVFILGQMFLNEYTHARSLTDRILGTSFVGVVPDTRTHTWKPALLGSLDHIFIGHGPVYHHGVGKTPDLWPHNAYLYYLYTLGLFGLSAFLAIVYKVFRLSRLFKKKFIAGTNLETLMTIFHIELVVILFEQIRADHQRDPIYMFFIWMFFGLILAAANIIKKKEKEMFLTERAT